MIRIQREQRARKGQKIIVRLASAVATSAMLLSTGFTAMGGQPQVGENEPSPNEASTAASKKTAQYAAKVAKPTKPKRANDKALRSAATLGSGDPSFAPSDATDGAQISSTPVIGPQDGNPTFSMTTTVNSSGCAAGNAGTWGTAHWTESMDGGSCTAHFGAGQLGNRWSPNSTTKPNGIIEYTIVDTSDVAPLGNADKIVFDNPANTQLPDSSGALFAHFSTTDFEGLGGITTTNVIYMKSMFADVQATSLNVSNWDTSKVTDMSYMFDSSKVENLSLSRWQTGKVTTMSHMFNEAGIKSLNVSGWGNGKVTDMSYMFSYASGLTTLNLSGFSTGNVTNMSNMFSSDSGLTTLNVTNFSTGNVTNMSMMFSGASGLTTLNVTNFSTGNVKDMSGMFSGASGLTTLNVTNFSTGNVKDMSVMFSGASGLTTLNVTNFDTGNVTTMSYMFSYASSLKSLDVTNFSTGNVKDMSGMFSSDSGLTTLNVTNFDTGNVKDMSYMFSSDSSLTTLNLSGFNTGNVTTMSGMFSNDSGLTTLTLSSSFGTGNVKDMSDMFSYASSLKSLDVTKFDTGNVTNMSDMFSGTSGLTTLNVTNFDTGNVTNMSRMFRDSAITALDISNFDMRSLTSQAGNPGDLNMLSCRELRKLTTGANNRLDASADRSLSSLWVPDGYTGNWVMSTPGTWKSTSNYPKTALGEVCTRSATPEGVGTYIMQKSVTVKLVSGYWAPQADGADTIAAGAGDTVTLPAKSDLENTASDGIHSIPLGWISATANGNAPSQSERYLTWRGAEPSGITALGGQYTIPADASGDLNLYAVERMYPQITSVAITAVPHTANGALPAGSAVTVAIKGAQYAWPNGTTTTIPTSNLSKLNNLNMSYTVHRQHTDGSLSSVGAAGYSTLQSGAITIPAAQFGSPTATDTGNVTVQLGMVDQDDQTASVYQPAAGMTTQPILAYMTAPTVGQTVTAKGANTISGTANSTLKNVAFETSTSAGTTKQPQGTATWPNGSSTALTIDATGKWTADAPANTPKSGTVTLQITDAEGNQSATQSVEYKLTLPTSSLPFTGHRNIEKMAVPLAIAVALAAIAVLLYRKRSEYSITEG